MNHKSNKFKSITKGLMGPNIIFPAVYILFSANGCPGFSLGEGGSLAAIQQVNKDNQLESITGAPGDVLSVSGLLGKGTLLNLGDYLCGVFVPSDTKEVFIIKLHSKDGWMQFIQQGAQADIVRLCYDVVPDPRIIKVDYGLLERLRQPLDQSPDAVHYSSDKEDFWRKIEKDSSWRDIEFCYGKAFMRDGAIFKEDGITSSTAFSKKLYKKFSSAAVGTTTLVSSKLSIRGGVASASLSDLEKIGFLLVKDANSLVGLVKNMLESGAEWATKAAVVDTKTYITCPAAVVDGALQFDGSDLDLQAQDAHSSVRLEGYTSAYCYFNDGPYYRLIPLDNVKSLVAIDKETCLPSYDQPKQEDQLYNTTPIPPKPLVDADETGTENEVEAHANSVNGEQIDPIPNSPEEEATRPRNPSQRVHTSPMGYTGSAGTQTSNPPTNGSAVSPPPPPPLPPISNTNGNRSIPAPPPMPNTNRSIPAPLLPLSIVTSGDPRSGSTLSSSPPPPPPLPPMSSTMSNINKEIPAPPLIKQANGQPKGNGISMMDELQRKISEKKEKRSNEVPIDKQITQSQSRDKENSLPPRDALLGQIRAGIKLKNAQDRKLNETPPKPPIANNTNSNGIDLQAALRKALEARKQETPPSSDSEESDNEFEDD